MTQHSRELSPVQRLENLKIAPPEVAHVACDPTVRFVFSTLRAAKEAGQEMMSVALPSPLREKAQSEIGKIARNMNPFYPLRWENGEHSSPDFEKTWLQINRVRSKKWQLDITPPVNSIRSELEDIAGQDSLPGYAVMHMDFSNSPRTMRYLAALDPSYTEQIGHVDPKWEALLGSNEIPIQITPDMGDQRVWTKVTTRLLGKLPQNDGETFRPSRRRKVHTLVQVMPSDLFKYVNRPTKEPGVSQATLTQAAIYRAAETLAMQDLGLIYRNSP